MLEPLTHTHRPEHGWIQTYTGRQFWPFQPHVQDVNTLDVAHALSNLCRYNGHVQRFYSVAEHSVLMSHAVPQEDALHALTHDSTEAYVGDMVRPLKVQDAAFTQAEDRLWLVLAEHFGLDPRLPASVKDADYRICLDERAALLGRPAAPWHIDNLEPLGVEIRGWGPSVAREKWLVRYWELTGTEFLG